DELVNRHHPEPKTQILVIGLGCPGLKVFDDIERGCAGLHGLLVASRLRTLLEAGTNRMPKRPEHPTADRVPQLDYGRQRPNRHCFHTSRAISTTIPSLARSSSTVSGLPVRFVAKPHCGLNPSCSRVVYVAASSIRA